MSLRWTSDEELFALARRDLYSAVIGDILDLLGRRQQFLPPQIQPLKDDMVILGRAMPVLEADDEAGAVRKGTRRCQAAPLTSPEERRSFYRTPIGAMACQTGPTYLRERSTC